ncbi:uncharacterized protein LOC123481042 [Coregonus clupeaformis]|uniref:uncharacterized protein LOC123481042 n=1 Tax=Coregonus clupeaformis TaxID=59861 RepID=UPI001E1C64BB|nr:uncharacterized protein LOC123481042 [Coregonus clupeaformis]
MDWFRQAKANRPFTILPSTSSGRLTLSGENHRRLKTEISRMKENLRFMKRMLAVPALLLTTLEEMNPQELKTFQSFLTSGLLPDCPPIPESQLENADIQVIVGQMVKTYGPERAVEITLRILRGMKRVDLAEKLETDHRGGTASTSHLPLFPPRPRSVLSPVGLPPISPLLSRSSPSFGSSKELLWLTSAGSSGQFRSQETPKLEMDCPPILDIPLEMANSVNTEVAVNTQENIQRMDEELGRERGSPLFLEHHHMSSPDEFTPEIHDQDNRREYQFQCPSAGMFQCSITGLVFRMEGEGEVLYRTVPWDRRLLAQRGKRPAGPLFKFTCLKGSVCQLHLPHCEIHSEGGCDFLSVAHVTDDDSTEFLHPHETTETHVILNINGFSKYGITKDKEAPVSPIRGLVLLFYQLPDDTNNSTLNVLLLPRNVDIDEVCKTRRRRNGDREIYIERNPNCRLTPDQEYTLSTDLTDEHHIDPEDAEFVDYDSYTNYMPTFQLDLQTVIKKVNLLLKEHDGPENERVWNRLVSLPASPTEVKSTVTPHGGATAGTTTNVSYLLLGTLAELVSEQLETFQWHLSQGVEDFPSIPKSQLENATRLATVDMMVQRYLDDGTVKITLEILREMGQNKLAIELKEKLTNECLNVQPQHNMSEQ